jgi:tRNA(fMet)-specific endonuclease VapC
MSYVLDTNIITALLKGNEKIKEKIQRLELEGKEVHINGISYYEIICRIKGLKIENWLG